MSDMATAYLQAREADPELEAANARFRAAGESDQQESILNAVPKGVRETVSAVGDAKNLGRNALVAAWDALRNTSELMVDIGTSAAQGEANREALDTGGEAEKIPPRDLADMAPEFVREIDGMRSRLGKGSTTADIFVQKALQFGVPFAGALKMMGTAGTVSAAVTKGAVADAAVSAAVWEPHEGRFADLLQEIAPDNSLLAPVIDYLASDPGDSDAEARFKNVLDGQFAAGVFGGPLAAANGFIRAAAKAIRDAKAGRVGITMPGSLASQRGSVSLKPIRGTDETTGLPLNEDGTVTVYHHTSADAAAAISRSGKLVSAAEPAVYVTTSRDKAIGYGDTVVAIRIDPKKLALDDEFPNGRRDFRIEAGKPGGSVAVKLEK